MNVSIVHQERYSRGQLLLRTFFGWLYIGIPHGVVLFFLSLWSAILQFVTFWVTLITGKFPEGIFAYQLNYQRWYLRVNGSLINLFDGYPSFGLNASREKVELQVERPERVSRLLVLLRTLFGIIYVYIPHGICLIGRGVAAVVIAFIAWWAVLFTGRYPERWHEFVLGTYRWGIRVGLYMGYMTDTYPPFSGKPLGPSRRIAARGEDPNSGGAALPSAVDSLNARSLIQKEVYLWTNRKGNFPNSIPAVGRRRPHILAGRELFVPRGRPMLRCGGLHSIYGRSQVAISPENKNLREEPTSMVDTRDCNASEPRAKGPRVRALVGIGVSMAAALLLLAACGGSRSDSGGKSAQRGPGGHGGFGSIPVQAVSVQYGPLDAVHNVAGSVVPVTQSQVAAQVSGVVKSIVHQAGDWVKAGNTIVQLDDSQLQLAVQNAQVSLKNAEINLTVGQQNTGYDTKKLQLQLQSAQSALAAAQKNYDALDSGYKQGTVSASSVDTAQSQLQTAQANYESAKTALDQNKNAETQSIAQLKLAVQTAENQLAQAKLNLEYASITAPFAGQISVVNVTPGEFVGQNTPAFLLVSSDREISFSVPPADAPVLAVGKSVSFEVGGETYSASVNQTPAAPVNGVVPLTAKLMGATSLPFGTVGTVSYPVTVSTGTLVPLAALQNDGSQNYVFTIVQNKAHVQPVTILGETGSTAAVSRLPNDISVIINPPPGLLEGTSVTPAGGSGGQGGGAGGSGPGGQGAAQPQAGQATPAGHQGQGTSRPATSGNSG